MNTIDSNAPAPLKYTDPTFQASLFVRSLILDTSGGSPVLENTVNLAQYSTSAVYWGKYTFTAGKTYLIISNVYTDGTYATVDTNYPQDTSDVQCVDLKIANLDASISSRNSTAHFDAIIGTPAGASVSADLAEIEGETDGIALIPTNPLLTTDSRLNNLDATISSREPSSDPRLAHLDVDVSTRLAAAGYTAPDNADIVAIKAKTDNLPADPASNTQVNTRVATTHFDTVIGTPAGASIAADIAEVEGETDGIAAIPTNPLLTSDIRLNHLDADISSREPSSDPRLANLDATVSSRLATTGYTAPDNTDIAAIKVITDQFTFAVDGVNAHTNNTSPVDVEAIADAVWDEPLSEHLTAGSTGEKLNSGSSGSGGSSFGVTQAVAVQPSIFEAEATQPQIVEAIAIDP